MADEAQPDVTGMKPDVLMATFSYVGFLVLVPIFSGATDAPFVKFHAKQGLVLFVGEVLAVILAFWLSYVGGFLFLILAIVSVAGLIRCLQEERWVIPGIGALANKFDL